MAPESFSQIRSVVLLGLFSLRTITRVADKSLARPTSRCRMTESKVSSERGVCSCAELQAVSCYTVWKEARQATRAISTTWRRKLSSSFFFFFCKARRRRNSRHCDRNIRGTCTIVCHRKKAGWPSLNMVIFSSVMRLVLDDPEQRPPRRLLIIFTS